MAPKIIETNDTAATTTTTTTATTTRSSLEAAQVNDAAAKATTTTTTAAAVSSSSSSCLERKDRKRSICSNVLDVIGETPLVRLHNVVPESIVKKKIEVLVKCEFFNAGGSVKDRIGKQMVLDAEREGRLKPGDTLIEPTSGNTGIGLALCAAIKGYRCIIVLPEKMSKEKVDVLKALGAEIVRTPTEAAYDAPDSHISVAKRLNKEIPNSHILDQYTNPSNPNAHYHGTAQEIWDQCQGKVDMVVAGAGTGGTITGIAKRLKELNPNIQIVGVDPEGSILAQPDHLNDHHRLESYQVEGIGYDFIPNVLDRSCIDQWYKSNDTESLVMMRKLIRHEGLLCGGSSGAAVHIACHYAANTLPEGSRIVVILPDSVRNYMTKSLSDDWMISHGFIDNSIIKVKQYETWWSNQRICDLRHRINTPVTITCDVSFKDAIMLLKQEGFDMVPVLDNEGSVVGVVTEGNMTNRLLSGRANPDTTVAEAGVIYKTFRCFTMNDTLADLALALDQNPFALIVTEQRCFMGPKSMSKQAAKRRKYSDASDASPTHYYKPTTLTTGGGTTTTTTTPTTTSSVVKRTVVSGIVTRIDLLDYISSEKK